MSMFDTDERRNEIIIVKRSNHDDEHQHHGGVWKIAFADFMTAMMCFFLVMWLVNAANEETKAAVASYFNPMTLVEATPRTKGLENQRDESRVRSSAATQADEASERAAANDFAHSVDQSKTEKTSDQHLFADPYAVLAEIAAQTANLQNISEAGDGGAQTSGPATGAEGGESYRDPFAPDFWSQQVANEFTDEELDVFRQPEETPEVADAEIADATEAETDLATEEPQSAPEVTVAAPQEQFEETLPHTAEVASQIREEIMEAFGRDSALNQTISVVPSKEGVLISVTDELNYGMFEVGSAVPQAQLVKAMETIGRKLAEHKGRISINGHTDARPFKSSTYDNWRLSTSRAHAAYYMLVRGGVPEERIRGVAGYADRELKIATDPYADANRRIEILLEIGE